MAELTNTICLEGSGFGGRMTLSSNSTLPPSAHVTLSSLFSIYEPQLSCI